MSTQVTIYQTKFSPMYHALTTRKQQTVRAITFAVHVCSTVQCITALQYIAVSPR